MEVSCANYVQRVSFVFWVAEAFSNLVTSTLFNSLDFLFRDPCLLIRGETGFIGLTSNHDLSNEQN